MTAGSDQTQPLCRAYKTPMGSECSALPLRENVSERCSPLTSKSADACRYLRCFSLRASTMRGLLGLVIWSDCPDSPGRTPASAGFRSLGAMAQNLSCQSIPP